MSTINIADKPTLDNISTCTSELTNRGGIRHNGTNPQVYSTNNTWVNLDSGGGSIVPSIVLKNHLYEDHDMDNIDITVYDNDRIWSTTINMGINDTITIDLPWLDSYYIKFVVMQNMINMKVNIDSVGKIFINTYDSINLVSWATGTDEEIVALINAADMGLVDLVTDAGWAIGDTRAVDISAMMTTMSGTYHTESHVAQTIDLVLMDIGDTSETNGLYSDTAATAYQLVEPVKNKNGTPRTNPSFIVGMKDLLSDGNTLEGGYMNYSKSSYQGWEGCDRRSRWCNDRTNGFIGSFPSILRNIFKEVNNVRTAYRYESGPVVNSKDYCILFASGEVFNYDRPATSSSSTHTGYSNKDEYNSLKSIEYYKTVSNRIKRTNRGTGSIEYWWLRSPQSSSQGWFIAINDNGNSTIAASTVSYGISPGLFI